ncbi:MAG: hypothetical protein JWP64_1811 [Pseudonocardia sp.]|jgi:hypothetical protein|uniref:hypothetical protein n=1 Tax=Pseudonocardia sp. TaxID=60912 RepID=UPI002624762D|nr:hypothetical protein [Pseudonocardia sp.]MCU1626862.1 hypothetical protein [Pseudonocardia sp.]
MAGKARQTETATGDAAAAPAAQPGGGTQAGGTSTLTEDVRPERPAEGGAEGERSATVNLPFVTAQFRAPHLHLPGRADLDAAARGAQSLLPSPKSLLFFGGLAATAVAGIIEWPVAAAIGVGTALASRGEANPEPHGGTSQVAEAETSGPADATTSDAPRPNAQGDT